MLNTEVLNTVDDITNIVNLELGQPLFAYDSSKIHGFIKVRESQAGEKICPIGFKEPISLPEGTLVVVDEEKIIAIAGVIGCQGTQVTQNTSEIILESSLYDPITIRQASKNLGIRTLSTVVFEKGTDYENVLNGMYRAVNLLEEWGWESNQEIILKRNWKAPETIIDLNTEETNFYLGTSLASSDIVSICEKYGFLKIKDDERNLVFKVPSHRIWDVSNKEDLYEEIARYLGYNNIPLHVPSTKIGSAKSLWEVRKEIIENILLSQGFYEIFTDPFYNIHDFKKLGLADDHPLNHHVQILNSQDKNYSLLKNNNIISAIKTIAVNIDAQNTNFKFYEWSKVFHYDPTSENGLCEEMAVLWGIVNGLDDNSNVYHAPSQLNVLNLKGLIELVINELSLALYVEQLSPEESNEFIYLHPIRSGKILLDEKKVGVLGEIHPNLISNFSLKKVKPCFIEISVPALQSPMHETTFKEPEVMQASHKDISILVPFLLPVKNAIDAVKAKAPKWLVSVWVKDGSVHQTVSN